jgi:hypothetical protein
MHHIAILYINEGQGGARNSSVPRGHSPIENV